MNNLCKFKQGYSVEIVLFFVILFCGLVEQAVAIAPKPATSQNELGETKGKTIEELMGPEAMALYEKQQKQFQEMPLSELVHSLPGGDQESTLLSQLIKAMTWISFYGSLNEGEKEVVTKIMASQQMSQDNDKTPLEWSAKEQQIIQGIISRVSQEAIGHFQRYATLTLKIELQKFQERVLLQQI